MIYFTAAAILFLSIFVTSAVYIKDDNKDNKDNKNN